MKPILCLIGLAVVLVLDLARAEPEPVAPDVRKVRHPSSGPTSYNSIAGPDSETLSKLQNQVAPSVQIPLKPVGPLSKPVEATSSYTAPSSLSSHPGGTVTQTIPQQYYMMSPYSTGNQVLSPATTPLIMQYINPQGQPTGGIQYIQLLRPALYPYGTQYVQPNYVQQQQQQQHQQTSSALAQHQHQHLHHPHSLSHYSAAAALPSPTSAPISPTTTTQSSFVPFQPSSLQQYATAAATPASLGHHHLHQSPVAAAYSASPVVGQYSSPVLSYFPPRISLINGPGGEMALNTNEYMPSPGDHVYIKGVKSLRA